MSVPNASPTTAQELEVTRRLRAVLKRSSRGLGLAAAFVGVFSGSKDGAEREAVKRILLGAPVEGAFAGLVKDSGSSGELLRFIATLAKISSSEASRGAERLSSMFDRWTLVKEKRAMEKKVMAFRGLIVSVVAGVVVGMLSTLAPVISGFQITLGTAPKAAPGFSPYEGVVFLLPSALCLGLFLSPQRPYLNVAVSLVAFAGVVYFLGPLASFSLGP
ncbi:MAG TPA: hypothetical protein VND40_00265 [Nitrososphaerales archaeon]|nr:hypothetical protein [Nitrososphaerales archaeon]